MGQMVDYVSQFEVDESYEQINYQDTPYRVTPLEYSDLIKWFTNRSDGLARLYSSEYGDVKNLK